MIRLIKNYPYDNNYDKTKLFSTKGKQTEFFNSFDSIFIDEGEDEGYIREGETFIVEYNYDYLVSQGVNYVIWNNGFNDLFCFIIKKEYVSEELTRIYYEIDVLQTFLFKFTIGRSFIERKQCTISEITDFDEGLDIGEHQIISVVSSLEKQYKWFAMFNGIKQQQLIFTNNVLTGVVDLPSPTLKPLTIIDGIQYPLHFMQLKESYPEPTFTTIETGGTGGVVGGDWSNGILSATGFRFIKGYEGFAPSKYQDSGGFWTIAYGVTLHGESDIYSQLVSESPISEERGARVSYELKNKNYGAKIVNRCKELGILSQCQFDALCSLAYNSGVGSITLDNDLTRAIKLDPTNESVIRPIWENFKVSSNGEQLSGLVARRKQECNMFFNKEFEIRKISIIDSNGGYNGYISDNNGDGWLP